MTGNLRQQPSTDETDTSIMQAKDIADLDFLRALDACQRAQAERPWAKQHRISRPSVSWGQEGGFDAKMTAEYGPFMLDQFPGVPEKVLRAKGRRLIDRGLMEGCMCGCRGDMEVTPRGLALLAEHTERT